MAKHGVLSNLARRSGSVEKISHDVLHNRFVLYFIFFLAISNLFIFVFANDMVSIGVFFVTGLLTSFFSKNMVVIMVISMVVTNIIRMGSTHRDGFGTAIDDSSEEKEKEKEKKEEPEKEKKTEKEEPDEKVKEKKEEVAKKEES